ncbi:MULTISPECIES: FAD assembly factor SdhE [Thiorhodovibrio]|uniref:FAD assembly factor SdhE n=1 Tax=Thiorhodovibrio TaxID=61593 RepID=UPI001F5DEB0A|nr:MULTISPECIES: succinate dehydrogenase assembly factor 2 [Thiorhodovibrio]WPL13236.1 Antitoxin CptB [Thiorhodovibrio litoralis]
MSATPGSVIDEEPATRMHRLRWQCRRGMLELDLLLSGFLEQGYAQLSQAQQADFVRLLEFQDQVLQHWLIGRGLPDDPAMRTLVERIQSHQGRRAETSASQRLSKSSNN